MRLFLLALLIIVLYRFVVFIVLPFLNITRTATQKMKAMQQHLDNMNNQKQSVSKRKIEGEFIDYEEVK